MTNRLSTTGTSALMIAVTVPRVASTSRARKKRTTLVRINLDRSRRPLRLQRTATYQFL